MACVKRIEVFMNDAMANNTTYKINIHKYFSVFNFRYSVRIVLKVTRQIDVHICDHM